MYGVDYFETFSPVDHVKNNRREKERERLYKGNNCIDCIITHVTRNYIQSNKGLNTINYFSLFFEKKKSYKKKYNKKKPNQEKT